MVLEAALVLSSEKGSAYNTPCGNGVNCPQLCILRMNTCDLPELHLHAPLLWDKHSRAYFFIHTAYVGVHTEKIKVSANGNGYIVENVKQTGAMPYGIQEAFHGSALRKVIKKVLKNPLPHFHREGILRVEQASCQIFCSNRLSRG